MNTTQQSDYDEEWVAYADWLKKMNISGVTGWRWRNLGAIRVFCVYGKLYITEKEIARFRKRAEAGEFQRKRNSKIRNCKPKDA